MNRYRLFVVIPALDEEETVGAVVTALLAADASIEEVIVVDNGSSDDTARIAEASGATVLTEYRRGYGSACLAGLEYLFAHLHANPTVADIVVFVDADGSDAIEDLPLLIEPIVKGRAEFVVGSRLILSESRQHVPLPSRFGNWLATNAIWLLYGVRFTDLGPFRAISADALQELQMSDTTWGWTLEMQLTASRLGFEIEEIPVAYQPRAGGKSKISGNLIGACRAGTRILYVLARHVCTRR
ncbi:MAG: glycosyltransferase family 2 protein [Bdellovibrionales bacterium]|nr:glycosyltransferase family 2 protein [Bdellovibrionales bacterium]